MNILSWIKGLFSKKEKKINVSVSAVKKHLKGLSKNQLIRFIIDQQLEIEILKKGLKK